MVDAINGLAADLEQILMSEFFLESYKLKKEDVVIKKSDEYVEFNFEASCEPTLSMTEGIGEMISFRLKKKVDVVSNKKAIAGVVYL